MARSILSFGMFSARAAKTAARSRAFMDRIGQAQFRGNGDFAGELGKELGADRILLALLVHDVFELAMSRHSVFCLQCGPAAPLRSAHLVRRPRRRACQR